MLARKQLAIGNDLNGANFKIRDPLPSTQIYAFAAKRFLKALELKFIPNLRSNLNSTQTGENFTEDAASGEISKEPSVKRLINFLKRICADLLAGRALLHPILLAAVFLAAKFGALYVVDEKILGSGYDLGIFGEFAYYIFFDFVLGAYFIALCAHIIYTSPEVKSLKILRKILLAIILASCALGYFSSDVNYQKLGVLEAFLIASLICICIYSVATEILNDHSNAVFWGFAYVLNYIGALFVIFHAQAAEVVAAILIILCPLAWAFYFKYEFQKSLAKDAASNDEILNSASSDEISKSKARTES